MEYCRNCGNAVIEGSKFCNACGEAIQNVNTAPDNSQIDNGNVSATTYTKSDDNKKIIRFLKSKWVISIVVLLILGFGSLYVYNRYFTLEGEAKSVVANYIKAIQNGDATYDFRSSDVADFYNITDYKFIKASKAKVDTVIHLDRDDWDKDFFVGRTIEKTYEKEKEYYRHAYEAAGVGGKVIAEDDDTMTIKTGMQHDELTLLYDLQAINGIGENVMKRVYFTLENDDYGKDMKITKVTY
ncbi:zinc ribbon domain-containing protein [Paenibacillus typhae]|uniref:Zinc-ribbon domain-containing protein n=1 Tax=Paenibacillus typhae TaxID=1174501 RepID=A0A1G8MM32_9BACL|nr:zinc ribbon domain-containing protein [Paenibacillus typhae]SDI69031.1 hypothetical protein SAMN05216192_107153 [Paenibacillus typhae]